MLVLGFAPAAFERLRLRIPASVRFGTSTWNYPGWHGLVYHQDYGPKGAAARMLKEYAAFPLFGALVTAPVSVVSQAPPIALTRNDGTPLTDDEGFLPTN